MREPYLRGKTTWLEPEEYAYGARGGRMARRGKAICEDGAIRAVRAGLPDSHYSIPAYTRVRGRYVRGFLMFEDDEIHFIPEEVQAQ